MKKLLLMSVVWIGLLALQSPVNAMDKKKAAMLYQYDADLVRLEHIEYWSGLIEEYKEKVGSYPFQQALGASETGLVRIATKEQSSFFAPESEQYYQKIDNNRDGRFHEFTTKEFVALLEEGLNRKIDERYDPQKVPTNAPVWYNYFVRPADGYLIWTVCRTCGVTPISTLLMDGSTATVNIASEGLVEQVTKAYLRDDMLNHSIFKEWKSRPYLKEGYFRELERQYSSDSKR
jgi:hypothetical protein